MPFYAYISILQEDIWISYNHSLSSRVFVIFIEMNEWKNVVSDYTFLWKN